MYVVYVIAVPGYIVSLSGWKGNDSDWTTERCRRGKAGRDGAIKEWRRGEGEAREREGGVG